jgi:methylmalonyl-CoA/ethylmalonyl-CoA epimerase
MKNMKTLTILLVLLGATSGAQQSTPSLDPGLKRIVHIGIITRDVEATSKRWAAAFGVEPSFKVTRPGAAVHLTHRGHPSTAQAKIGIVKLDQFFVEIVQPLGPDSSWQEFLDAHGEGVHHIAFEIADLDGTVKHFENLGMPVQQQGRTTGDDGSYTYLDSKAALGLNLEFLARDLPKR